MDDRDLQAGFRSDTVPVYAMLGWLSHASRVRAQIAVATPAESRQSGLLELLEPSEPSAPDGGNLVYCLLGLLGSDRSLRRWIAGLPAAMEAVEIAANSPLGSESGTPGIYR